MQERGEESERKVRMKEGIPSDDISFMKTYTSPEDSIAISIAPHTCRADRTTAYPGDISFIR